MHYIKRVVGVPGDRVVYDNKRLTVNGKTLMLEAQSDFYDERKVSYLEHFTETLGKTKHSILLDGEKPSFTVRPIRFTHQESCQYYKVRLECTVPEGHYFVMGDNRDNSRDSRFWGFVPEANLVGHAFFIWMNLSHPSRIGTFD